MAFFEYALALIVTFGILVTVHEFGHYIIARKSGVRVLRFSIGFGKPLFKWVDSRNTEFVVSMIPLGGYVRMLDLRDPDQRSLTAPGDLSHNKLSVWWRIAIAVGGPLANFLLAVVVYWAIFIAGTQVLIPVAGVPSEASPAAAAGLSANMELVSVDGRATPSWQQVGMGLAARLGDTGTIEIGVREQVAAEPGSATRVLSVRISDWHRGADEPDLLGSLGIVQSAPPILGEVLSDSPASAAGLRPGDRIVSVDGEAVADWQAWVAAIVARPGVVANVGLERQGVHMSVMMRPDSRETTDGKQQGYLGVGPPTREIHFGPLQAVTSALEETWDKTKLTLSLVGKMVTGDVSVKNLSGPFTIAQVAGDSARSGWRNFFSLLALLSISLGVLNLLPVPILDGGQIMFCIAELIKGKPLSERSQVLAMQVGVFIVGGMMFLALYNDFGRIFLRN